eukprot:3006560-Rhodomonas_salina.1
MHERQAPAVRGRADQVKRIEVEGSREIQIRGRRGTEEQQKEQMREARTRGTRGEGGSDVCPSAAKTGSDMSSMLMGQVNDSTWRAQETPF